MPFRLRRDWRPACLALGMATSFQYGAWARVAGASAERTLALSIPGGSLVVAQQGASTTIALFKGVVTSTAKLPPDDMVSGGTLESARLIGLPRLGVLLIETTYASQTGIGGNQVQCAAGQESILRVIALAARPRQTAEMRVTSCWNDIYKTSMTWIAAIGTLVIEDDGDAPSAYVIDEAGSFKMVPVPLGTNKDVKVLDLP